MMMLSILADTSIFHAPSSLEGEGWGEGLQASSLRYGYDEHSLPPLPNPLPQGERGFDCSNIQLHGSY
jgi:hypothetical protein